MVIPHKITKNDQKHKVPQGRENFFKIAKTTMEIILQLQQKRIKLFGLNDYKTTFFFLFPTCVADNLIRIDS